MTIGKTCLQPQPLSIRNSAQYGSYFITRAGLSAGGWAQGEKEREQGVALPAGGKGWVTVVTWNVVYSDDGGLAFELLTKFLKRHVFDYTQRLARASFSKSGSAARAAMITRLIDGKKMSCQLFCDILSQSIVKQKLVHRICWLQSL